VVHAAHALASRGHRVTVFADRAPVSAGEDADAERILADLGLAPTPTLDLRLAPTRWRPGASAWFRGSVVYGCAQAAWDVVLAREGTPIGLVPQRVPVVLEAHGLESALVAEAGGDPRAAHAREGREAARARAFVANGGGTLNAWEQAHTVLPKRRSVLANATGIPLQDASPRTGLSIPSRGEDVVVAGSLPAYKGALTVLAALDSASWPVGARLVLLGGGEAARPVHPDLVVEPGLPAPALGRRLARARVLLVPLVANVFGRELASPLKLWDALASCVPIVAPDLPTVHDVLARAGVRPDGEGVFLHAPGVPDALAEAVARAWEAPQRTPRVRTWGDRAAELEAVLLEACAC
jgi:glycosyltransferase involved in cell wall biosynthesis